MSAPGPQRAVGGRQDWATPWPLFRLLDREFRFEIDAAASFENRKCERYLTEEEDALQADLFDRVVFCNPPYARALPWVSAFVRWSLNGCTVVALMPSCTDTEWFRMAWWWAHEVRFLTPRVNFEGSKSGNTQGSVVFVFRPQPPLVVGGVGKGNVLVPVETPPVQGPIAPQVSVWNWRAQIEHESAIGGAR